MKRKILLKPSVKELLEVVITGLAVGIVGFIIASIISFRLHSIENDPRFELQKKTELSGTQISQK